METYEPRVGDVAMEGQPFPIVFQVESAGTVRVLPTGREARVSLRDCVLIARNDA